MKYLKLFESFDDEGWIEVPFLEEDEDGYDEETDEWMKHKTVKMDRSLIKYVSDIISDKCKLKFYECDSKEYMFDCIEIKYNDGTKNKSIYEYKDPKFKYLSIFECEDQWYKISDSSEDHKFYICDQFDGLENLLKYKNLLK